MPLHHVVDGEAGERVVLVHGFTQTLAAMEPLAARLRDSYRVVRVDLPGHGGSGVTGAGLGGAAEPQGETGGSDVAGEAGERVVLVHGFTQTLAAMEPLAARLRDSYRVVRVDLPGHGGSAVPGAGFAEAAALLGETGGSAAYLGYSLGGRLCLRL